MSEAGDGTDAAAEVPAADLAPVIELLKSDDDAARIDGATKLKEIASEPRCASSRRARHPSVRRA